MNKYAARYKNALKKAAVINRFLKKGYHVINGGSPVKNGARFIMRDNELLFKHSDTFYTLWYQNDAGWDHGYWTPIKEWNKEFTETFEVYKPSAKVKI